MADLSTKKNKELAEILYTRNNISQKEVAARVGVSEVTMSRWVNESDRAWEKMRLVVTKTVDENISRISMQLDELNHTISETKKRAPGKAGAGGKQSGPKALDIGCATGALLAELRQRGWDCAGVEICEDEAEYARRERGLDVRGVPLEENRFPDNHFDAVLASHLIEHLNDPAGLVREVHRVLSPGGRFFVTTPNIGGFQAKLFKARWRSAIFDHLYLFSAQTLTQLLTQKGFWVEKIATWGGLAAGTAPAPVKRLFDRAAKKFGFGDVMLLRAAKAV